MIAGERLDGDEGQEKERKKVTKSFIDNFNFIQAEERIVLSIIWKYWSVLNYNASNSSNASNECNACNASNASNASSASNASNASNITCLPASLLWRLMRALATFLRTLPRALLLFFLSLLLRCDFCTFLRSPASTKLRPRRRQKEHN